MSEVLAKPVKRKRSAAPKRYGFRTCRRPDRLGQVISERKLAGGVKELLCWTANGWRTYRVFPRKRGELWMVWSGFDS
jgi:hypothetical protein